MNESCEEFDLSDFENYTMAHVPYPFEPTFWRTLNYVDYLKMIVLVIIIIGGLLGNISAILTVALNRSMRTTINFYVANLAVADALICIICMVPLTLQVATTDVYILGEFMCKFNPFTQMACLTSSVLTLSAISCDRFVAIMFPLHVRITKQRTSVVITIVWLVSALVALPLIVVKKYVVIVWHNFVEPKCTEAWPLEIYYEELVGHCIQYEPLRPVYYVIVCVSLFFLPIFIMVTAYSLILWRLSKSQVPGEQHAANVSVHSRAKKKVNKMVFVVLVAFVICWTPFQALVLVYSLNHNAAIHGALPDWFSDFKWFSYLLAYSNSFVNPIIYGGFNKAFRDGFFIVLRCGYQKNKYGRPARSRLTFTTGVTSSPSRNVSRTMNGATKSQKMEMKLVYPVSDGDTSPKETCVSVSDVKDSEFFT